MKLAFVFRTAPHGLSVAREGLDTLLAAMAFCEPEEIGVFFIHDGILNLLVNQQPEIILQKDFTKAFKLLSFYGIENCFVCQDCIQYQLLNNHLLINVTPMPYSQWLAQLQQAEKIFTF